MLVLEDADPAGGALGHLLNCINYYLNSEDTSTLSFLVLRSHLSM